MILSIAIAVTLLIGGAGYLLTRGDGSEPRRPSATRIRGVPPCDVPDVLLQRVRRGYVPGRSGDVLTIEWEPNQFLGIRHSTPFPYTQDVPLLLYGPGYIKGGFQSEVEVTLADLAPTYAELLGFKEFSDTAGKVLTEALVDQAERSKPPKLIFTLVWDGGGDNLLRQWPDAWPHFKQLIEGGAFFTEATVGSSPSITPAVHATIGTGFFPNVHGQTDMDIRVGDKIKFVWQGISPRYLEARTLSDLWDAAQDNRPLVGLMARDSYHLGMIGHGAFLSGGDHDIAVIDDIEGTEFITNEDYYALPEYMKGTKGLKEAVEEVDLRDGSSDGMWLGNSISVDDPDVRATPAWPIYQSDRLIELLDKEGFGTDGIPDLFYTNYKSTDLAGHAWNLVEPEERDVLQEQDRQLQRLLNALDDFVGEGNYVLALTADHGITPYPSVTGGWPIDGGEVSADISKRFDTATPTRPLIVSNRGYQLFLDEKELRANDVEATEISAFLRDYRLKDNVPEGESIPREYAARAEERLFLTALTPSELDRALSC